ncbi:MAG: hypothetical protein Q7S22_08925 [Candidatus Micrarchaeota archaeon]|nr:hypothetical protein [Candidatus Micrarchaeota archaeon]
MITKKFSVRRSAEMPDSAFRGSTLLLSDLEVTRHLIADFIVSDLRAGKTDPSKSALFPVDGNKPLGIFIANEKSA